jgi:hypothetical protein
MAIGNGPRQLFVLAAATALLVTSLPVAAQWMWKDEAGHTVASDQPPPAGTPQSRILKEPRPKPQAREPAPAASDKDATKSADASKSIADRELESKMRQKEAADAAKKADDDAARAIAMKENCNAVRSNVAALQSGGRAARYNDKGEMVYIDDSERQNEINKQQAQVAQYCNK